MRKLTTTISVCCLLACALGALAGTYTFRPNPGGLNDLPHANYFIWGIQWNKPDTEVIQSATLTYRSIWDWTEESDHLYTHLLDTVTSSNWSSVAPSSSNPTGYKRAAITGVDNQGGGDNFSGQGYLLGTWSDPHGGHNGYYAVDVPYTIPADKLSWLADGNWGIAVDPDCHYYNCGVKLIITTIPKTEQVIPEANTMLLAALGVCSLAGLRRFRVR